MKNISAMVHQPSAHTQWPATYPKQLQVSLEVTTSFLRCAHKVYTIVNAVQILQCHLATESPGQLRH